MMDNNFDVFLRTQYDLNTDSNGGIISYRRYVALCGLSAVGYRADGRFAKALSNLSDIDLTMLLGYSERYASDVLNVVRAVMGISNQYVNQSEIDT